MVTMEVSSKSEPRIKTGIYGLAICFFVTYLNSAIFVIPVGSNCPYMHMGVGAFVINTICFVLMWFFFARGKRERMIQSIVAILLHTMAHYFYVSNVMSLF